MSQKGNRKYFDGSIVVNDGIATRDIATDAINGVPVNAYLTSNDVPNPQTLKDFKESDGGLIWKGVQLVPPNEVMTDRPYTNDEITAMIETLWDKYSGDDPNAEDEVDPSKPGGSTPSDWINGGGQ